MGLFNFLKKVQEKADAVQKNADDLTMQLNAAKANIERAIPNPFAKKIAAMFYSDYPEVPYISRDRNSEWIEMATTFPNTVPVQKSMMIRYADGLLPGHVYMLYWLKKYTTKKVPAYFEYKYGIDFEKEKAFLLNEGFLNSMSKPTDKGNEAIRNHGEVIANHAPQKPDLSVAGISKQILKQRDSMLKNGFEEYEFIANRSCCKICARLNGKHFPVDNLEIGVNAPPMHDGCSCSIAAYVDRRELDEILDYVDQGRTYEAWKKAKKKKK